MFSKTTKSLSDLETPRKSRYQSVGRDIVSSRKCDFLETEPYRANPLEYRHLKRSVKIPYWTKVDFDRRVYGELAEKPIKAKGIFSNYDERPRNHLLSTLDTIKAKHEKNDIISPEFLEKYKEIEYHLLYNRKPLKQFRDVNTRYYESDRNEEVFTNTHPPGVIMPPGNPYFKGLPTYLKYP